MKNLGTADLIVFVAEVPGNITQGTLTISGSTSVTYNDAAGSYTQSVASPVSIPIAFPAG